MIDRLRPKTELTGPGEARRVGTIRNHADDLRFQLAIDDRLLNGLEVRAATRQEDRQADHSIQLAKPDGGASYTTRPSPFTTFPMKK